MREFIRGSIVEFRDILFRDADNETTVPESACLRLRCFEDGVEKFPEVELTETAGVWAGDWDSADADAGIIYWSIRPTPAGGAIEGQFRLRGNPANGPCTA